MDSHKVRTARMEFAKINSDFQSGVLLSPAYYDAFERQGINWRNTILIDLVPEGIGTFTGTVLTNDGRFLCFDIDVDASGTNEWKDVSKESLLEYKMRARGKPWEKLIIAYENYLKLKKSNQSES